MQVHPVTAVKSGAKLFRFVQSESRVLDWTNSYRPSPCLTAETCPGKTNPEKCTLRGKIKMYGQSVW